MIWVVWRGVSSVPAGWLTAARYFMSLSKCWAYISGSQSKVCVPLVDPGGTGGLSLVVFLIRNLFIYLGFKILSLTLNIEMV